MQIRKPGTETNDSAPEMQPFAPLPGYEPMGPPQDTGYEVLSASEEVQEQLRDYGGTYETLSVACPQRAGSQTEPGSRNIPVSAPLYEVPPIKSPPLYEIAPPPRTVNPVRLWPMHGIDNGNSFPSVPLPSVLTIGVKQNKIKNFKRV